MITILINFHFAKIHYNIVHQVILAILYHFFYHFNIDLYILSHQANKIFPVLSFYYFEKTLNIVYRYFKYKFLFRELDYF